MLDVMSDICYHYRDKNCYRYHNLNNYTFIIMFNSIHFTESYFASMKQN